IENKHKRKASIEDTEVYIKDLMKKIRLSDSPNCKNIEPNNVDYAFVLDVVYSMPNVFDDEKARKEEFRRLFREHYKITFNDYAGERMTTDGTSFSKGGMYMISNLEVKPESGVGGCCPYNQGNAYYAKYIANLPIQDIIKTQLPCFLLYLAGPYIGIAGALDALDIYYQNLPWIDSWQIKFPYITSLKVSGGAEIQFKYLKQLYESKLLFLVEQYNDNADCTLFPQRLLVKFVQQYGIEAHKTCADLGIAPKFQEDGKLVMVEFLEDDYELLTLHETTEIKKAMHNAEFVHGDLRCENILCKKKQKIGDNNDQVDIVIIDFDWAGRLGQKTTNISFIP
ncbi:16073_t:CDS:2, partial [Entrophospora sp. SA101]